METTVIGKDQDVWTVIFEFDVEPEQQPRLRDGIERLVAEIVSKQPGFIAAHLHLSQDGRKVLNYFQWESQEAFEAFRSDEEKQRVIRQVIGPYDPKPRVYDIVYSAVSSRESLRMPD